MQPGQIIRRSLAQAAPPRRRCALCCAAPARPGRADCSACAHLTSTGAPAPLAGLVARALAAPFPLTVAGA